MSQIECADGLTDALIGAYGTDFWLTPPQCQAIENGVLSRNAHFLICTPTNSGKTLVAVLRIFHQALAEGKRSLYVTPLKAIAEEKRQEFERISGSLKTIAGQKVKIRITTGDYQLTDDFPDSPPPQTGDIILCTPERLEILLRNPEHHAWTAQIANVIVDEIHLLGEAHRGPNLEVALTRLRLVAPHASVMGLSATVGGIRRLADWLGNAGRPVTVIESSWRFPPLNLMVTYTPAKHGYLKEKVLQQLQDSSSSLLIFTYRKADARKLAKEIASYPCMQESNEVPHHPGEIGDLMRRGVAFFHAGLSLQQRSWVAEAHRSQRLRVVVATTSLKMGVNLPTSHVFVRDHAFWGSGNLPVGDLLQMVGRAGRGDSPGYGEILVDDEAVAQDYSQKIVQGILPSLEPQLFSGSSQSEWSGRAGSQNEDEKTLLPLVLSEVVCRGKACAEDIALFLRSTFSGFIAGFEGNLSLALLKLQQWHLVQKVEGTEAQYEPRPLGRTVALSGIHPRTGAAFGGLLVGLIRLSEREKERDPGNEVNYLRRITDLDLLFMACCGIEAERHLLKPPTKKAVQSVQEFIERLDPEEKPVFNLWRSKDNPGWSPSRLLASLKVSVDPVNPGAVESKFYQIMQTAVLLYRHVRGQTLAQLAPQYHTDEGDLEQGLKYSVLWLLSAIAQICDNRKCYKLDFLTFQALELIDKVSQGSGLAPLMKLAGVGKLTIQKLSNAGYRQVKDLGGVQMDDLEGLGIPKQKVRSILKVVKKTRR